jgi:hypothetical protein
MEFQTDAQRATYEKIAPMMKEEFGMFAHFPAEAPVVLITVGSAIAQTTVFPWGTDDATVCTRAYVVSGVQPTAELMRYLLSENCSMRFGAFGIDQDDDVLFEHTVVGSTIDREELKSSVIAVVGTADRYDDQIVARWGGQTALDKVKS